MRVLWMSFFISDVFIYYAHRAHIVQSIILLCFWHVTELRNYKYRGHYGGNKVGNRERQPHAVDAYLAWQEYQQRNREHHRRSNPTRMDLVACPTLWNKAVEII